jgi:hypothetical protein
VSLALFAFVARPWTAGDPPAGDPDPEAAAARALLAPTTE